MSWWRLGVGLLACALPDPAFVGGAVDGDLDADCGVCPAFDGDGAADVGVSELEPCEGGEFGAVGDDGDRFGVELELLCGECVEGAACLCVA